MCFDKGAPKRRLDRFLVVFQVRVLPSPVTTLKSTALRPLQGGAADGCRFHAKRHAGRELDLPGGGVMAD